MATLTQNQQREWQAGDTEAYPVIAADIIYQGAAVGENGSGYSRPLVALDAFQGFAIGKVDNSTGVAGNNSLIGYVSRWISSGVCVVEFDAIAVKAALQV